MPASDSQNDSSRYRLAAARWGELVESGELTPDQYLRGLQALEIGFEPSAWIEGHRIPLD